MSQNERSILYKLIPFTADGKIANAQDVAFNNLENTIYISTTGDDASTGRDLGNPVQTFTRALTIATALTGSTSIVCLDNSTYTEDLDINLDDIFIYAPNAIINGNVDSTTSNATITIRQCTDIKLGINSIAKIHTITGNITFEAGVHSRTFLTSHIITTGTLSLDGATGTVFIEINQVTAIPTTPVNLTVRGHINQMIYGSGGEMSDITAQQVSVNTTGFDGNLSTSDSNLQTLAQTVDDLIIPTADPNVQTDNNFAIYGISADLFLGTAGSTLNLNRSITNTSTEVFTQVSNGIRVLVAGTYGVYIQNAIEATNDSQRADPYTTILVNGTELTDFRSFGHYARASLNMSLSNDSTGTLYTILTLEANDLITTGLVPNDTTIVASTVTIRQTGTFMVVNEMKGIRGLEGTRGQKGDVGDQGPTGPTGPQGIQGMTGVQGETGPQGNQGEQGETGPQGPAGTSVAAGVDTWSGMSGIITDEQITGVLASLNYRTITAVQQSFLGEVSMSGTRFDLSNNVYVAEENVEDLTSSGTFTDFTLTFPDTDNVSSQLTQDLGTISDLSVGNLNLVLHVLPVSSNGFLPNISSTELLLIAADTTEFDLGDISLNINNDTEQSLNIPITTTYAGTFTLRLRFNYANGLADTYRFINGRYSQHSRGNLYQPVFDLIQANLPSSTVPTSTIPDGRIFTTSEQKTRTIDTINLLPGATHESEEAIDYVFYDNTNTIIGTVNTGTTSSITVPGTATSIGVKGSDSQRGTVRINGDLLNVTFTATISGESYFFESLPPGLGTIDPPPSVSIGIRSLEVVETSLTNQVRSESNRNDISTIHSEINDIEEVTDLITRDETNVTSYTYGGTGFTLEETPVQINSGSSLNLGSRNIVNDIIFGSISRVTDETILTFGSIDFVRVLGNNVQASVATPLTPSSSSSSSQYVSENNGAGAFEENPVTITPGTRNSNGDITPEDVSISYTRNLPTGGQSISIRIDGIINGIDEGIRNLTLPFGGDVNLDYIAVNGLDTNVDFRFRYANNNSVIYMEVTNSSSNAAVDLAVFKVWLTWEVVTTIPEVPAGRDWVNIGTLSNSRANFIFGIFEESSTIRLVYNINGSTGIFDTETPAQTGIVIPNSGVLIDGWLQNITFAGAVVDTNRGILVVIANDSLSNIDDEWLGYRASTQNNLIDLDFAANLVIADSTNGNKYRLVSTNGVLSLVQVTV